MNKDIERIKKAHFTAMTWLGGTERDVETEQAIHNVEAELNKLAETEDELKVFKLAYEWKCNGVEGTYEEVLEKARRSIADWKEIEARGYGEVVDE